MKLVSDLLEKMQIQTQLVSDEIQEDLGLALIMKEVDRTGKVSIGVVLKKLND